MNNRKWREQEFHDHAYRTSLRADVSSFYTITTDCHVAFQQWLMKPTPPNIVLELGCGTQPAAATLPQSTRLVCSIDLSPFAVQTVRDQSRTAGLTNTNQAIMDAELLAFPEKTFDLVCGVSVLHHLSLIEAYEQIARVLKPNGRAVFIEPMGHNPLINLYRRLTPNLRTPDEHPLRMADLCLAQQYFGKLEFRFFYLFGLAAVALRSRNFFSAALSALNALDRAVFRVMPFTRRLAWIAVMNLSEPRPCSNERS